MTALSPVSPWQATTYGLNPEKERATSQTDAVSERVTAAAKAPIAAASAVGVGAAAPISLCAETRSMLDYQELTRRIPKGHLELIEARMSDLSRDPVKLAHASATIKARLVDGAYGSLPDNYYYYGLIGVRAGSLSVEQFSILVDYMTLTAQGVEPTVVPLFFINEKGEKILNNALADSILFTLKNHLKFESQEKGYAFLESTFKDLPPEALQVQVYDATWDPTKEFVLPEGTDGELNEAKLVKNHQTPVVAKLFQLGFNLLNYYVEEGKYKRLSVSTQLIQCLLDSLFKGNAVRINPVLGVSSVSDLRDNGRTSTRDQGMSYIIPAENEKGYDFCGYDCADTYSVVDLDFRDHDRYHAWVCSAQDRDYMRYPLMAASDFLSRIANIASYLREKETEKKKDKEKKLSEMDRALARGIESMTPHEELKIRFGFSVRTLALLDHLVKDESGDCDVKAVRHLSWLLTDMEILVAHAKTCFDEGINEEKIRLFCSSLMQLLFFSETLDFRADLERLKNIDTPLAERAREIIRERLLLPKFSHLRHTYEVEMIIYEGGFFSEEIRRCIRESIHGKDLEPSFVEWLGFRITGAIGVAQNPAASTEGAEESIFPFLEDLTELPASTSNTELLQVVEENSTVPIGHTRGSLFPLLEDLTELPAVPIQTA